MLSFYIKLKLNIDLATNCLHLHNIKLILK
jgi:hypothetical protein